MAQKYILTLTDLGVKEFVMPVGYAAAVEIYCWGAGGGTSTAGQPGGGGGYAKAIVTLNAGDRVRLQVGQPGSNAAQGSAGGGANTLNRYVGGSAGTVVQTVQSSPSTLTATAGDPYAAANGYFVRSGSGGGTAAPDIREYIVRVNGATIWDSVSPPPATYGAGTLRGEPYVNGDYPGGGDPIAAYDVIVNQTRTVSSIASNAGGGGASASAVEVNGIPVCVAAGGGGGGAATPGLPGGSFVSQPTDIYKVQNIKWGDFLNAYGVWSGLPNYVGNVTVTASVTFGNTATYNMLVAADNVITVFFDDIIKTTVSNQLTGATWANVAVTAGTHVVKMLVTNTADNSNNNVGGAALQIFNPDGSELFSSLRYLQSIGLTGDTRGGTAAGIGLQNVNLGGGGGGGYLGGRAGTSYGAAAGQGEPGNGGLNYGDETQAGSGSTGAGKTVAYFPSTANGAYGNSGYQGAIVLVFTKQLGLSILGADGSNNWVGMNTVYYKSPDQFVTLLENVTVPVAVQRVVPYPSDSRTLAGSGTWQVPPNVYDVSVLAVGGGASGDGQGGGGGSGAVVQTTVSLIPGDSIPYSVGRGGQGATYTSSGGSRGDAGASTLFGFQGTYALAGGGNPPPSSNPNSGGSGGSPGGSSGTAGSQGSSGGAGGGVPGISTGGAGGGVGSAGSAGTGPGAGSGGGMNGFVSGTTSQSQTFSAGASTYYVPAGVYSLGCYLSGAGGAGGTVGQGSSGSSNYTGFPVNPGDTISIYVGYGGSLNGTPTTTQSTVRFSASGTFTIPPGTVNYSISAGSGGGGGGGGHFPCNSKNHRGGNGGAGASSTNTYIPSGEGDIVTFTVGLGGIYGSAGEGNPGSAGGTTTVYINGTQVLTLGGGLGGAGGTSNGSGKAGATAGQGGGGAGGQGGSPNTNDATAGGDGFVQITCTAQIPGGVGGASYAGYSGGNATGGGGGGGGATVVLRNGAVAGAAGGGAGGAGSGSGGAGGGSGGGVGGGGAGGSVRNPGGNGSCIISYDVSYSYYVTKTSGSGASGNDGTLRLSWTPNPTTYTEIQYQTVQRQYQVNQGGWKTVAGIWVKQAAGWKPIINYADPISLTSIAVIPAPTPQSPPLGTPSYVLTRSAATVDEGSTVTVTLTTANVQVGTALAYTISGGGIAAQDFSDIKVNYRSQPVSIRGAFVVQADLTSQLSLTLAQDSLTEGNETLTVTLDAAAVSTSITVVDTSQTPPPTYSLSQTSTSVNEGDSVSFTLITSNLPDGTVVPFVIAPGSGVTTQDFARMYINGASTTVALTGNFVLNQGVSTLVLVIANDVATEGSETFTVSLTNGQASASVNIIDTSRAPTFTIVPGTTAADEGTRVTWTITTTDFGTGTLYWTNIGTTSAADFTSGSKNSGTVSIVNDSGSLTLTLFSDLMAEGPETIVIQLRTGSASGAIVATAATVTVADTSFPSLVSGVAIYTYTSTGTRVGATGYPGTSNKIGNRIYVPSAAGLTTGVKYYYILGTSGTQLGYRTLSNGTVIYSRAYDIGIPSYCTDITWDLVKSAGATGRASINGLGEVSNHGSFTYNPRTINDGYNPPVTGHELASGTYGASDAGKGGAVCYIFQYADIVRIFNQLGIAINDNNNNLP